MHELEVYEYILMYKIFHWYFDCLKPQSLKYLTNRYFIQWRMTLILNHR